MHAYMHTYITYVHTIIIQPVPNTLYLFQTYSSWIWGPDSKIMVHMLHMPLGLRLEP